jgi:hypothetical protein
MEEGGDAGFRVPTTTGDSHSLFLMWEGYRDLINDHSTTSLWYTDYVVVPVT